MNTLPSKSGPITRDEVAVAYAATLTAGESATLQNIRTRLGDRGSLGTIKKYRAEILQAAEEEERRKNPEIPGDEVRHVFLGQAEHLLMTGFSAGLRRGRDISREIQTYAVTLEEERDQLLSSYEAAQRTMEEKDDEFALVKNAAENALSNERQRVDEARSEAHAVRLELTEYQARAGGKIEALEEALRAANEQLTRAKLALANARGKIALLTKADPHAHRALP